MLRKTLEKRHAHQSDGEVMVDLVVSESQYIEHATGLCIDIHEDASKDCWLTLLGHEDRLIAQVDTTDDPIDDLDRLRGLWCYLWQGTSGKDVSA